MIPPLFQVRAENMPRVKYASDQSQQNNRKHFHSQEVLGLLEAPLARLILELLVLQGLPERQTDNKRKRQLEGEGDY